MEGNNRAGMTDEQLQSMMAQMGSAPQAAPTPAPAPVVDVTGPSPMNNMSMSTPAPAPTTQRQSAQQAMRERMRQSQQNQQQAQQQQVVLTQTNDYRPVGNQQVPVGNTLQTPPVSTPNQAQPVNGGPQLATTTLINTTAQGGVQQGEEEMQQQGGFKLNKNFVFIAVAVILAVLLVAYFIFGSEKKPEDTTPPEEDIEWLDPVGGETFLYTPTELDLLRSAGYTGPEIESNQAAGVPAQELIDIAAAKRDAWMQQAVAPLYDTASDEYKHYISQTWLTLPRRTDAPEWTQLAAYYNERKNLDYEKVDVYGNQLFIKVYLDDTTHDDWFYLCVTPEDWLKLGDYGNVVVNYTYARRLIGDDYFNSYEDMDNIFITAASLEIIN